MDSELGEIPEGWEVNSLGELMELAYGKALKQDRRADGTVSVYGSNGKIGWHNERLVEGPGIVVGRKGTPGVVTWAQQDFFPIDTTYYVVPRTGHRNFHFLFYALEEQNLQSIAADSAVPGLNRNLAYMNRQVVPTEPLLAHFNDHVQDNFSSRALIEQESLSLAIQRDLLLPKLMSGELHP